jgi:hypothetical protein
MPCAVTAGADTLKHVPVSLPLAPSLAREGSAPAVTTQDLVVHDLATAESCHRHHRDNAGT